MRGFPGGGGTGAPFRGTCPPCSRLDQNVEDMYVKSTGGLLERAALDGSLAVAGRLFFLNGACSQSGAEVSQAPQSFRSFRHCPRLHACSVAPRVDFCMRKL